MSATRRQISNAMHLIINGAMQDVDLIDVLLAVMQTVGDWSKNLSSSQVESLAICLDAWFEHGNLSDADDKPTALCLGTVTDRQSNLVSDLGAMLGDDDCPTVVRELLTKYDLNP
jgi:hypothetical protein